VTHRCVTVTQQSSIHYKNIKVMTKLPYTQH